MGSQYNPALSIAAKFKNRYDEHPGTETAVQYAMTAATAYGPTSPEFSAAINAALKHSDYDYEAIGTRLGLTVAEVKAAAL